MGTECLSRYRARQGHTAVTDHLIGTNYERISTHVRSESRAALVGTSWPGIVVAFGEWPLQCV